MNTIKKPGRAIGKGTAVALIAFWIEELEIRQLAAGQICVNSYCG
jgi:hypothetical protein